MIKKVPPLLERAVLFSHEPLVKLLLDRGAYIERDGDRGGRILECASGFPLVCDNGPTFLSASAPENNEHILQLLIETGADVKAQNANPIMVAAHVGCAANLKVLLENGASINKRGARNRTALMKAAREGHKEAVATLLKYGALVLAKDMDGWSALQWSIECRNPEIRDMLVERMLELPNHYTREQIMTFLMCVKRCYGKDIYSLLKNPKCYVDVIREANEERPGISVAYLEVQDLVAKNPRNCPDACYSARNALNKKYFGKK